MGQPQTSPDAPEIYQPLPRAHRPIEWGRARRALRTLVRDPDRTDQVFELIGAVSGGGSERIYQRCRRDPRGRRLLDARPSLLAELRDLERLESFPAGSLGASYGRFMRAGQIQPTGLAQASEEVRREVEPDPERRFFFERLRDMHDLWHVVTGYGRDIAGEAALLAFTHGQTRNRGIGLLALVAAWRGPWQRDLHWQRYLWSCWRRGRRARPLAFAPWEEWLAHPLAEVRRELSVEPPELAHPGGVITFDAPGATA